MKKEKIDPDKLYRAIEAREIIMDHLGIGKAAYYTLHHKIIPGWFYSSASKRIKGINLILYIDRLEKQKQPWKPYQREKNAAD